MAAAIALAVVVTACGGGSAAETVERDPIRVQAQSVEGSALLIDDLGGSDTVLWFWAPW